MKENRNLLIIALIAIVNALGYGIIIPILYSYSLRFGLNDFENGLLFASYSLAMFLSTPIIGRLSDKYGRRPLLIVSIGGTAVSFFMMAFAPSALFLFLARIIDGITAGNIPVASAVISDTTTAENRAKGFGIIGASFGFGLVFGPAISGLTIKFSPSLPFIIAGTVSLIAVVITYLLLPETNKHIGEVKKGKIIDLPKLYHALFDPNVGTTFLITFFYYFAFATFIFAFQPFAVKVLHLDVQHVSYLFVVFGLLGLLMQVFMVQRIAKRLGLKRAFMTGIFFVLWGFIIMFLAQSLWTYVLGCILIAVFNAIVQPLISTILSRETDAKSQGSILGLNSSYMSLGQIVGPIVGGGLATISLHFPFLGGAVLVAFCLYLSTKVMRTNVKQESAF